MYSDSSSPLLTVMITTYNHCDYVERAIDSVLSQSTEYEYEIVIHDDASTDGTQKKLISYQEKHPERIKLLLEKENQYSKGRHYLIDAIRPLCKGQYMIFLEGDDYWCDNGKIQKQLDFFKKHPDASAVTHKCENICVDANGSVNHVGFSPSVKYDDVWDIEDVIDWRDAPHLTSFMFKTDLLFELSSELLDLEVGDWVYSVWMCSRGKMYYIDEVMSVHEQYTKGSYSERNFGDGVYTGYENLLKKRQQWCDLLDEATDRRYHDCFCYSQDRRWGDYLWDKKEYKAASRYKGFARKKPIRKRLILFLLSYFPGFETIYRRAINR